MPGTFTFKPIKAELSHDTDLIGKMNPYCALSAGHSKVNGPVCERGGKTPAWNESFSLNTFSEDTTTASLDLMDKEEGIFMRSDDLIGSCSINLSEVEKQGHMRKWYSLFFKDAPAGKILMDISFQTEGSKNLSTETSVKNDSFFVESLLKEQAPLKKEKILMGEPSTVNEGLFKKVTPYSTEFQWTEELPIREHAPANAVLEEPVTINISAENSRRKSATKKPRASPSAEKISSVLIQEKPIEIIKEVEVLDSAPKITYTEQSSIVEPHVFLKQVENTEIVSHTQQIKVMEPRKVLKDVQYTMLVPVTKEYEIVEPEVVTKEIEVIEPQVFTRYIKVVENVKVSKEVEVIEMQKTTKEVEVLEPRTFKKTVEVVEYFPVKKFVEVTEPVTVTKTVEFVEPVITTQTIVKEMREPIIVGEVLTQEVGPASLLGERLDIAEVITKEEIIITNVEPVLEIVKKL